MKEMALSRIWAILVGIVGLLSILTAFQHWFQLDVVAAQRGIESSTVAGNANIRADVGGLFLAIGLFMLIAAWKRSRQWALAALVLILSALIGRLISLTIDGAGSGIWPPILVELLFAAMMFVASRLWTGKTPEGL